MNPNIIEQKIWRALRQVIDPELGCNIVDLGLIYAVDLIGTKATVTMTLTTPGCPMHESLTRGVEIALLELDEISEAEVNLVWEPPWEPCRLTEAGRHHLGVYDA